MQQNQKSVKRVIVSLVLLVSLSALYFLTAWIFADGENASEYTTPVNNLAASTAPQDKLSDPRFNQLITSLESISTKIDSINARQNEFEEALERLSNSADVVIEEEISEVRYEYTKQERQAILESGLNYDDKNDPWVATTTESIENLFVSVPAISVAKDSKVTCGNKLCKVSFIVPKSVGFSERTHLQMQLLNDVMPLLSRANYFTERLADGSELKTYYMAREGYSLPTETLAPTNSNINSEE